jgi:hypothetical protein
MQLHTSTTVKFLKNILKTSHLSGLILFDTHLFLCPPLIFCTHIACLLFTK